MTALELLEETKEYYTKDTRRRSIYNGVCFYSSKNSKSKGTGCAIGRKLSPKQRLEWDDLGENLPILFIINDFNKKLPKSIRNISTLNLAKIQRFHDSNSYWDKNGLTKIGERNYEKLKAEFKKQTK